jgi:lipopolysaccharide transport system permease protein
MAVKESARESAPVIVIRPRKGWWDIDWRSLWEYRELLYFFIWRDVKVRYKQTLIGARLKIRFSSPLTYP